MSAFRLNASGDLDVASGALVLVSGGEETRQRLSAKFRFFLGEWFLDRGRGIPYFESVFIRNPRLPVLEELFRRVLRDDPGVREVVRVAFDYDPPTRTLRLSFELLLASGEQLTDAQTIDLGALT
jgi:hypothetical protein